MKSDAASLLLAAAATLHRLTACDGFAWNVRLLRRSARGGGTNPTRLHASVGEPPSEATLAVARGDDDINDDVGGSGDSSLLAGVEEFEAWFSSVPGANVVPTVRHRNFGNLRGLGCADGGGTEAAAGGPAADGDGRPWMTIPRSVVLRSDLSRPDWDSRLAQDLWQEVLRGRSSRVAGYTALLVRGWTISDLPRLPPSSARDALRHWTDEQRAVLASGAAGRRLLDLQEQQERLWRGKFADVNGMTWGQFEWAMEVVHSRAFCGDFGVGGAPLPPAVAVASPVLAAFAGYAYYVSMHGQNDAVLLGLAAVAALPAMINLVTQSPPVAVLLPFIDSANHLEEANSMIEYSPLTDAFDLTGGRKCLVTEANGKEQFYISYGKKKDSELLLNYGFLLGVSTEGDASSRRKKLAETFLANDQ